MSLIKLTRPESFVYAGLMDSTITFCKNLFDEQTQGRNYIQETIKLNDKSSLYYGRFTRQISRNRLVSRPEDDRSVYRALKSLTKKGLILGQSNRGGSNRWWPVGVSAVVREKGTSITPEEFIKAVREQLKVETGIEYESFI